MEAILGTPGVLALVLGVALLIVSIIGGGLEIKEIKIPKLQKSGRIILSVVGVFLVGGGCLLSAGGLYLAYLAKAPSAAKEVPQTAPQKIEIQIDSAKINQQLPTVAGIPNDVRQGIVNLIVNADNAEISGIYYKDKSYLTPYYLGDALTQMEAQVDDALNTSDTVLYVYAQDKSYYVGMRQLDATTYSIDACEYWAAYYYDGSSGALVTSEPEALEPQTITIELQNGQYYLTSIASYSGNVFCTH